MSAVEPVTQPAAEDRPLGEKHEPTATGAALLKRVPVPLAIGKYVLSDDEIRRTWRLSSALAASGMFKDAKQAEIAFGKILLGRDLGISPTQALMTVDIVKGNVQLRGVLLASFIRRSKDYDYRIVSLVGDADDPDEAKQHATIRFFALHPDGEREALHPDITFTMAMARKQGNVKADSAWMTTRRNMLFWRCMSDGAKFHCPELLAGIPVYVEHELDGLAEQGALGEGQGDGRAVGLDLGPDVEKVIARAEALGHAALADRPALEVQLGDQSPGWVARWVKAANSELDAMPVDAEVVEAAQGDLSGSGPPAEDPAPEGHEAPETAATGLSDEESTPSTHRDPEAVERMRDQANELLDYADQMDAEMNEEAAETARAEAESLMIEVEAAEDPGQETLPL